MHEQSLSLGMPSPQEITLIPVIPVDILIHTNEHPFCGDATCPCHEDPVLIASVAEALHNGLLTREEATCFVTGQML